MRRGTVLPWGAVGAYLDVCALQVAVGYPALEVGSHLLGGAVAGHGSQARFLAASQAAGSSQHRAEERQVATSARSRRLQPHLPAAAPPAPQPRVPQLPSAAQRPLQAPRRAREVAAVVGFHAAGVQLVEGLQGAAFPRAPTVRPARRRQQQRQQQQSPPKPAPGCHARRTGGPCDGVRWSEQWGVRVRCNGVAVHRVAGLGAIGSGGGLQ